MTREEIILAAMVPMAAAGARWAAIALCEWRAAKAEADGVENWEDLFWAKMLRRLSTRQYKHVKNMVASRPQPDEQELQP